MRDVPQSRKSVQEQADAFQLDELADIDDAKCSFDLGAGRQGRGFKVCPARGRSVNNADPPGLDAGRNARAR